jgi:RecJ-like exonuclease
MKIFEIMSLIDKYGENATLKDILLNISDGEVYKCPKCNGKGTITVEYNAYPSGLPDSGFVYEAGYRNVECKLCGGEGYTKVKYRPKMIQDGWEEDS